MTSIRTEADSSVADRAQTVLDWTRVNSKWVTTGAVVIVVAAVGYWFYQRSKQIEATNAERALNNARQSMESGNMPLAQKDLQTVFSKYESTTAGVEAAMLLAQIDYDTGKYQDGISVLDKAAGSSAANGVQATIKSLQGDGYAQMHKLKEAGQAYEQAAGSTSLEMERAFQLAKAARAYGDGGDTAKARQIWTNILNDKTAQSMDAEARVRLGELTAKAVKR
jgi:predicted negative regulator of RcsB-dependent stress response